MSTYLLPPVAAPEQLETGVLQTPLAAAPLHGPSPVIEAERLGIEVRAARRVVEQRHAAHDELAVGVVRARAPSSCRRRSARSAGRSPSWERERCRSCRRSARCGRCRRAACRRRGRGTRRPSVANSSALRSSRRPAPPNSRSLPSGRRSLPARRPRPAQSTPATVSVSPAGESPSVTVTFVSVRFAPTISTVRDATFAGSAGPLSVSVAPATCVIFHTPAAPGDRDRLADEALRLVHEAEEVRAAAEDVVLAEAAEDDVVAAAALDVVLAVGAGLERRHDVEVADVVADEVRGRRARAAVGRARRAGVRRSPANASSMPPSPWMTSSPICPNSRSWPWLPAR